MSKQTSIESELPFVRAHSALSVPVNAEERSNIASPGQVRVKIDVDGLV